MNHCWKTQLKVCNVSSAKMSKDSLKNNTTVTVVLLNHTNYVKSVRSFVSADRQLKNMYPNPATKQILKDLPVYCPHYKNECREMFLQAESLDDHQKGCVFRQICCPELSCKEKILFKDVIEHLKQIHGNRYWFVATGNKHTVRLGSRNIQDGTTWPPQGIKINSGVDLFLVGKIIHRVAYFWLYVMSSPLQAKNYSYTLSVTGKNGNKFSNFNDYAKPLDEGSEEVIENQLVFMIGTEAIKTISENNALKIEVTIHDLKEEAKDDDEESGVEDE